MGLVFSKLLFFKRKSSLSLSDMPIETIDKIVDFLEPIDRFVLRNVSHSFRTVVDSKGPGIKTIHMIFTRVTLTLVLNDQYIECEFAKNRCIVKRSKRLRFLNGKYFIERAFDELSSMIKIRKLQLHRLLVRQTTCVPLESRQKWNAFLKTFFEPLNIFDSKSISLWGLDMIVVREILSHCEEGTLNDIYLGFNEDPQTDDALFSMPQWKTAKQCDMTTTKIPIETFFHFSRFSVNSDKEFTVDDAMKIRDVLLQSSCFEECALFIHAVDPHAIAEVFGLHYEFERTTVYSAPVHQYVIGISDTNIIIRDGELNLKRLRLSIKINN